MGISSVSNFNKIDRNLNSRTNTVSPNWSQIPHKGMATLSQDEIIKRVQELGVEAANASGDKEMRRISDETQNLFNQYMSHVSPDRKSLYEQALKTIKEQSSGGKGKTDMNEPKTLIDFLNERDGIGKGMKFDKTYSMSGGGTITAFQSTGGGAIFHVDYMGENVLQINAGCPTGNGVFYVRTAAEQSMMQQICNVYFNALDGARGVTPTSQTSNSVIDIKA